MENNVKELSELTKRFLKSMNLIEVSGFRLWEDGVFPANNTLTKIRKGIQQPSKKTVTLFCEKYGVSEAWLYTGNGNMMNDLETTVKVEMPKFAKVKYVSLEASASFVESLYDNSCEMDYFGVMTEEGEVLDDDYMVFQINGDSMTPTIPDRCKILAKRIDEGQWENASGVVVVVYGKSLVVKRILKNSLYLDNCLVLKSDNPIHGEMTVERREMRGMWQAVRIISQKIV